MNSRVVELESVLSRATPDRHEARQLAVELADTLDATTARRHVDRLLRCVSGLTRIGSADAGEELLDAMLDLVEPGSDEAAKVRDQRNRVAVAQRSGDPSVPTHHALASHPAAHRVAANGAAMTPHAHTAHRLIGGGTPPHPGTTTHRAAGNGSSPPGDGAHRPAAGAATPQPIDTTARRATANGAPPGDGAHRAEAADPRPTNAGTPPAAENRASSGDAARRPATSGGTSRDTAAHRLIGNGTAAQRPSPCAAPPNAHTGRAAATHAPTTSTPRATPPHPPTLGSRTPSPRRPDQSTAARPTAPTPPPRSAPDQFTRRYDPSAFHSTAGLAAIGVVPAPGFSDLLTAPPGRLPVLEAELRRATAAFGADDPRTVAALVNLVSARFQDARDRGSAEDAREAVDDLREAADRASTALGPHHPKVLVARSNLASAEFELARVRRSAGQTQLALPALRAAADVSFAKLGPDDPHTLVAQASLAAAELEVARVEGAHTQARRSLDTVRTAAARAATVHGSDHPAARLIVQQLQACEARTMDVGMRTDDVRLPVDEAARLLSPARPAVPLTRDPTSQRAAAYRPAVATDPQWPADSLLGRLRDHTRQELLTVGTVVRYAADRELIEQDARDTHAYLLLDGVVKVQVTDESGDTAVLAIRVAGDLVGEMAALDHRPRSATVVTCGDVVAKLITSAELVSFLHRRNDMFVELIAAIDDQLRWANKRRRDFLSHSAAERVARVLVELVGAYGREERGGWTLGIPLTKVELASIAGMKPRTAEKAFSDLRKAGVVVSHYRRDVLVPDLDHLRRFARMT